MGLQNLLGTQNFSGPKIFPDTFLDVKFCGQIFLRTNNFWPKLFRTRLKFSRKKISWTQIFLRQIFFSPSIFTGKKMLEHKIIWTQIWSGYKLFWHKLSLKYIFQYSKWFLLKLKLFYPIICLNAFFNPKFFFLIFLRPKIFFTHMILGPNIESSPI